MYKLAVISILLLLTNLAVFTVPCWLAILSGVDGFEVIMTSYMGKIEQILDVIILTSSLLLGTISAVWLFKFTYFGG